jgi:hypothetical protein
MSVRAGVEEVRDRDAADEGGGIDSSRDDIGVSSSLANEAWLSLSAVVEVS